MLPRAAFVIVVSAVILAVPAGRAQQRVPGGAKALLLSGGQRSHHAYRRQAYLLQKLLEDTRQFEVTVCEDAAVLETPALAKYDLIVATADRRDPEFRLTAAQQRALLAFVGDGKGFFSAARLLLRRQDLGAGDARPARRRPGPLRYPRHQGPLRQIPYQNH